MHPIIDTHVHIMPYYMVKPAALELIKHGRVDYVDVERYSADPKAFLGLLDSLGVERAGLINYVAPQIIGFTPEVNDWSANYYPLWSTQGLPFFQLQEICMRSQCSATMWASIIPISSSFSPTVEGRCG